MHRGEVVPGAVRQVGGVGDVNARAALPPKPAVIAKGNPPVAIVIVGGQFAAGQGAKVVGCWLVRFAQTCRFLYKQMSGIYRKLQVFYHKFLWQ